MKSAPSNGKSLEVELVKEVMKGPRILFNETQLLFSYQKRCTSLVIFGERTHEYPMVVRKL